MAEGGNAIEAMVAMAATIAAVYPHMNHIGGDGFWLVRERSGRVRAVMAAGRAGARASREFYAGHDAIPARGPLAALTVPGRRRRIGRSRWSSPRARVAGCRSTCCSAPRSAGRARVTW